MIKYALCKSTALFSVQAAKKIKPMDAYDYSGFCEVLKTADNAKDLGDVLPRTDIRRLTMAPVSRIEDLTKIELTEYYIVKGEWVADIKAFTPSSFTILIVRPASNGETYKNIVERLI